MVTSRNRDSTRPERSTASEEDSRLAGLAVQSPEAFAALYERYIDLIFNYCVRRVDNPQIAEDITATVFERAYSRISTFRGDSFRSWLFRIAHNAVTDHYRRRRDAISWQPEMSGPDHGLTPEEHAIASEQRTRVQRLLRLLTDDQRRVVELRLSGLAGAEIADVVGRSPDAVKMLQYRALERLRTHLSLSQPDAEMTDE